MNYAASSLDPLPNGVRHGMVAMGTIGVLSSMSTLSLLIFITYRMIYWRRFYYQPIHTNQIFILIYNLLLADLQQAMSFLFAFYWISQGALFGPSPACFAQGWLIQIGDVSSGLFVLAIGVHTMIVLVVKKTLSTKACYAVILSIWAFTLLLTALGPILHTEEVFIPAGAWCWIGSAWEHDRLYLHYLWIFMAQLGSLAIYIYIFFHLRLRAKELNHRRFSLPSTASSNNTKRLTGHGPQAANQIVISSFHGDDPFTNSRKKLQRTARTMVVYPVAYIILTLPLAIGRVAAMAGKELSLVYFCVAGTMMATCGVMDVLLYLSTRKAIIKSELGGRLSNNNSGGMQSSHDPSVLDPVNYRDKSKITVCRSVTVHDEDYDYSPQATPGINLPCRGSINRSESVRNLVDKSNDY